MITRTNLQAFLDKGLSILPLKKNKIPNTSSWQQYTKSYYKLSKDVSEFQSVGLITGEISGGVQVVDVDSKYWIGEGDLIDLLEAKVELFCPGLWKKLTIQKTINNGYHLIYKVDGKQDGSVKLAQREPTEEEAKEGQKKLVLLETRSANAYIVCFPSDGYKVTQGKLLSIKKITKEERDTLFAVCRTFDEILPPVFQEKPNIIYNSVGEKPWESYCNDTEHWKSVMRKHGWQVKEESKGRIRVVRPGKKEGTKETSGNFSISHNLLRVFSTSTVFDSNLSYNPFGIYTMLECNGDIKMAAKELRDLGYGTTPEPKYRIKDEAAEIDDTHEFLVSKEVNSYIDDFAEGKIPMGLTTGYDDLDEHYRFKPQAFDIIGGTAGLGKTTIACFLFALSNALHGKRTIIYSTENPAWELKVFIMEFLYGEKVDKIPKNHRDLLLAYMDKQFAFIETEDMLSYLDILNMVEKIEQKQGKFDQLFIDPWNALVTDYSEVDRKLNTYQYTLQVATRLQKWCKAKDMSLYIGMHSNTESARRVHQSGDLKGNPAPLNAADLAEGVVWENKCSHMLLIHRYKFVEELRNQTQIAVKKVKSRHTGGLETPLDKPVLLNMGRGKYRDFYSFYDSKNISPLRGWFKKTILGEEIVQTKEPSIEDYSKDVYEEDTSAQEENDFYRGNTFRNVRPQIEEEEESDVPY